MSKAEHTTRPETTNFRKFQTTNPVVRRLIERFYGAVFTVVGSPSGDVVVLDAGCGEGETLARWPHGEATRLGLEINPHSARYTKGRLPICTIIHGNIHHLPLEDRCADVVLCLEVLEHLEDPGSALMELDRVCRGRIILSVPHEPWFRLGSLARGKYLATWGNHPEHINHWTPRTFHQFLARYLTVESVTCSFPWIIASCRRK